MLSLNRFATVLGGIFFPLAMLYANVALGMWILASLAVAVAVITAVSMLTDVDGRFNAAARARLVLPRLAFAALCAVIVIVPASASLHWLAVLSAFAAIFWMVATAISPYRRWEAIDYRRPFGR